MVDRIGFVPPRYGADVVGGAEAVVSELAHGLSARGHAVDIVTTCARDHYTWANEYEPGETRDGTVVVRRFPTVMSTDRVQRAAYEAAILSGQPLTVAEQQAWMNDGLRVPELFHWLLDHAHEYRALVFAPYLFWTTFAGAQLAPDRSILMPCLHDEPYAHLELFRPLFADSCGIWFLSEPEHGAAHRIFPLARRHAVIGAGVRVPQSYDPDGFRQRHGIDRDFILFAGRREGAKGWELLLDAYAKAVARHDISLALVTMGVGPVNPPASIENRVIDLGFLQPRERDNAFAAAAAYIQPSQYESFSRTIMEAWLAGTVVIANGASEVVRWHCERSGAGLLYDDEYELAQCLLFVQEAPQAAAALAARGRAYVIENYSPERVLARVEETLDEWLPISSGAAA